VTFDDIEVANPEPNGGKPCLHKKEEKKVSTVNAVVIRSGHRLSSGSEITYTAQVEEEPYFKEATRHPTAKRELPPLR